VFRARGPDGVPVAVKVPRVRLPADPRLLKLLDTEVRAMARLDHPGVAWVYDHGRVGPGSELPEGTPYLVLEHCGGGTLDDRRPTSWDAVRDLAERLLDALAHAHARGIVHRDVKPSNVLFSGPSDVRAGPKLADFGIAAAIGERSRRAGTPN
jgi:serine/threonine protein kinase